MKSIGLLVLVSVQSNLWVGVEDELFNGQEFPAVWDVNRFIRL